MKHTLLLSALLYLVGHLVPPSFSAEPSFEEGATERLRAMTAGDTSGVAVLVARDGKIAFQGGFGLADIEKKTPITPETKFRIGSISKQFTAAAAVRLAEQGKLSLDDPLAKYFPDFPGAATMTVSRDGSQLFAQLTRQPKFPIFPTSETDFEWRAVAAKVRFVKGEDGKVTKGVHQQNGTKFDVPKIK
ncbi:MAG: serine hydrolase [Pirellulaceae bacterium]